MNGNVEQWQVSKAAMRHPDGMVAAQHHIAAAAGADMLHRGGNAVDAAVAAALALGAVEPWMCGLGGSGLMVVWLAAEKRAVALDFQGVLAGATDKANYPVDADAPVTLMGFPTVRERANLEGYRAVTVPGAASGFDHAIRRFGTMDLAQVAAPAVALAGGQTATWFTTLQAALAMEVLSKDLASASIYLPGGRPVQPETRWAIPGLADTLAAFGDGGAQAFYRGDLGQRIAAELAAGGSAITADDLAAYETLEHDVTPVDWRGAQVHAPGDSSGGTRMRDFAAHVQAALPVPPAQPTPETWAIYAQALDAAWGAHNARIGRATEVGSCTSHLSAIDAAGNMVALTHTLLNRFGAGVTLPGTGLMMNNAVSYFDPRPGFPTTMAPRKRINASNMCPAVITRDGAPVAALGASGGNQIMPAVTQCAALMLDFGMTLEQALNHPRIDGSGGTVRADPALGQAVLDRLAQDRIIEPAQRLVFPKLYACVSGVAREGTLCAGLSDPSQPVAAARGPAPFDAEEAGAGRGVVRA